MEWQIPPAKLSLNQCDVHIWQAQLGLPIEQIENFRKILSSDEIIRADRFKFDHHRNRFIVGRGILRSLLAQYLNLEPQQLEFGYGSHGKPFLKDAEYLQFNLAHSQDLALYGVTHDRAIGIDVEQIRQVNDLEALTRRFFSQSEHESICQTDLENRSRKFFRYWTCKEAFLKATGRGISQLQELELSIGQSVVIKKLPDQDSIEAWSLKELTLNVDFVGAIAIKTRTTQLKFKYFYY